MFGGCSLSKLHNQLSLYLLIRLYRYADNPRNVAAAHENLVLQDCVYATFIQIILHMFGEELDGQLRMTTLSKIVLEIVFVFSVNRGVEVGLKDDPCFPSLILFVEGVDRGGGGCVSGDPPPKEKTKQQ